MSRTTLYKKLIVIPGLIILICGCKVQKIGVPTPPETRKELIQPEVQDTTSMINAFVPQDSIILKVHRLLPDHITIKAVGDIMLGTNFPNHSYLPDDSGKNILKSILPSLQNADLLFGNLEGVILNEGGQQKKCNNPKACFLFRSPEYMISHLKNAGFDMLSVANNHAGDFGQVGRNNTSNILDSLNINFAGNSIRPYTIFRENGVIFGFAAFAPNKGTPNINDIDSAKRIITMLDSMVDIVIVSMHAGAEGAKHKHVPRKHEYYYGEDRGDVYSFAHGMIDAGADIILGHGPHVPRALDLYKGRFITYSLGNFATYGRFNLKGENGLAPILEVKIAVDGTFLSGKIIPAHQVGAGIVRSDPNGDVIDLIRDLTIVDFPESGIIIDTTGNIYVKEL